MKRSELEALGLNAEQIDSIMASNGRDIQAEKSKLEAYREKSEKADELQKKLDEIEANNMTELEKATKMLESANKKIAELENAQAIATLKQTIAEKFKVTSEQASKIIREDGSMDYDILAEIISEKEVASARAKEIEIAKGSSIPSGEDAPPSTETEAEKLAKEIGKQSATASTTAQSVVDSYL